MALATARQGTVDKANSAIAAVVTAQTALDQARASVATAEAALAAAQAKSGLTLRNFRSDLELKISDVVPYGLPAESKALAKAYLVELEDGERYDYAAAVRIRDYLVSVQNARLAP